MATHTQTVDPDLLKAGEHDLRVKETIDTIFEGGAKPHALIIYADYGPGHDLVRVACVGSLLELNALRKVGAAQLVSMIEKSNSGAKLNG